MLTIENVTGTNFMQYRTLDFSFKDGVRVISGRNRAGKSSIFEAVYWCLYGRTARGAKIVRTTEGEKTSPCTVQVRGKRDNQSFLIERIQQRTESGVSLTIWTKDPKKAQIFDAGNLAINQETINKFLGLNAEFFLASTLFGNKSFRFTQARDSDRKALFEEALNLGRFTTAQSYAKIRADELERTIGETNAEIMSLQREQEIAEQSLEDVRKGHLDEATKKVKAYKEERRQITEELSPLAKQFPEKMRDVTDGITDMNSRINRINIKITDNLETLNGLSDMDVCSHCLQKVTKEHKTKIRKKLESQNAELEVLRKKLATEFASLNKMLNGVKRVAELEEMLHDIDVEISHLDGAIDDIKADKTADLKITTDNIKRYKHEINEKQKLVTKCRKKESGYRFWEMGFGRQGVISLLIDEAIEELNENAVETSMGLSDGEIVVLFDSTTLLKSRTGTSDKISMRCILDGDEYDYSNLSQSEQQRIDICGMFGWQRMIANRAEAVNVLFFDEIFDGMDEQTAEWAYAYIRTLGDRYSINVISHAEHLRKKADRIATVRRTKSGSIIEYTDQ